MTMVAINELQKMILVVRNDLKMGKGKIAAQCGHATLGVYRSSLCRNPSGVKLWEAMGEKKVVVKCNSESELIRISQAAHKAKLVYYIVVDAGHTQVDPNTKTVLAIGPASDSKIQRITGHLKLL
jgi:PTH2 family peptidyl-tRNA hydrolase